MTHEDLVARSIYESLTPEVQEAVQAACIQQGVTLSVLFRDAIIASSNRLLQGKRDPDAQSVAKNSTILAASQL